MAVVNTKSTAVTAWDIPTTVPIRLQGGTLRSAVGTVEVAAADDNNSVYRFCRLNSADSVRHLWLFNDAITSGTDYDLGLYDTAENGGAVVSVNLFGDAISMASARVAPLDCVFEYLGVEKIEKPIWELLGLSADPGLDYDLCLTGVAVGSGAGTLSIEAQFVGTV